MLIPTFFFKLGLSRNKILNTGIILIILGIFLISCHEEQGEDSILDKNIANSIDTLAANHINGDSTALLDLKMLLDSFLNHTNKATSKVLNDYLLALASNYLALEYYGETTPLFHQVINLAERNGDIEINRVAHVELAWAFFNLKTQDSLSHYLNSIRQYPQTELSDELKISCFNLEASIAADEDRFLEAIDYYLKALELLEGSGNPEEGAILENLGVLYSQLKNHERALSYYQKALPFVESLKDTASLIRICSNMGVSFMRLDSLDKAVAFHLKALTMAEPNSFPAARSLSNYGNVLRRQGRLAEAEEAIDSSLNIAKSLEIPMGIIINKINLANVKLDNKNPVEALELMDGIELQKDLLNKEMLSEYYDIKSKIYEFMGDIPNAFVYTKEYLKLRQGIQNADASRLVMEFEEKINREKNDQALASLSLKLENANLRQRITIFFTFILVLLVVSITVIIWMKKQRQQLQHKLLEEEGQNLRLQLELKERELTSQSIHLQSISGFAEEISQKLSVLRDKLKGNDAETLSKIIRDFEVGIPEELYDDFRLRFEQVNESFYKHLLDLAPDLTPVEIKIASFLRLNLSSKEISKLTNRSSGTISNTRSSLRKKLKLEDDENLVAFLMSM